VKRRPAAGSCRKKKQCAVMPETGETPRRGRIPNRNEWTRTRRGVSRAERGKEKADFHFQEKGKKKRKRPSGQVKDKKRPEKRTFNGR